LLAAAVAVARAVPEAAAREECYNKIALLFHQLAHKLSLLVQEHQDKHKPLTLQDLDTLHLVVQVENLNKLVDPEVAEDRPNPEVELDQEHLDKETLVEEETTLDHLIQTLEAAEEDILSRVKPCLQVDL
jgi:hypothetical protein